MSSIGAPSSSARFAALYTAKYTAIEGTANGSENGSPRYSASGPPSLSSARAVSPKVALLFVCCTVLIVSKGWSSDCVRLTSLVWACG